MRNFAKIMAVSLMVLSAYGCNTVLGIPTLAPQKGAGYRTRVFDKDLAYCRKNTLEALNKWQSQVIRDEAAGYIVAINFEGVFKNCIDTTEADIFFKDMGDNKTEVGVSSLNCPLSHFVATNLFAYLDNPEAPTCKVTAVKVDKGYEKKRGTTS